MANLLLLTLQVRFTITANRLINFLCRVPLIRKVITPQLYGNYGIKLIFTVLGAFFTMTRRIMFRIFYMAFLTLCGIILYQAAEKGGYPVLFADYFNDPPVLEPLIAAQVTGFILTVWFIFSYIGSFTGPAIATPQSNDIDKVMVIYMRADASLYAKTRVILAIIADILLYLPYVIIAFIIARIPAWCVFPMMLMYMAFRLAGEVINLLFFSVSSRHFSRFPYTLFGLPVLAAVIYIPVNNGIINWAALLTNPLTLLISAITAAAAWFYIYKYQKHTDLIRDKIRLLEETINEIKQRNKRQVSTLQSGGADKWHKNIDTSTLAHDKHSKKTGFAYLNAVFFDRHSAFFKKKMVIRCAFILIPILVIAGLMYIESIVNLGIGFRGRAALPFNLAPVFFFVMYVASMGRVVTASVFSNCDIQMLHYPYYRTAQTTAASFKARFKVILKYNMIISVLISLSAISSLRLLYGFMDYRQAGVFSVLMMLMGLFFAFNDLFLYYIMQPYDSAGESKSIVYKIINVVIYVFAYMNINLRLDMTSYTIFIAMVTVLYLGIGVILLARVAPKRFKLR